MEAQKRGLTEREILQARREGDVAQEHINILSPYFRILRENIHKKWEELTLDDGQNAKYLKFQLRVVQDLERAMIRKINEGKQATKKIEDKS